MTAAAALAFTIAPTAIVMSSDDGTSAQADGCYNGVTVLNPYGKSCTLPGPVNKSAARPLTPTPSSRAGTTRAASPGT
jgi:hypothetical protein